MSSYATFEITPEDFRYQFNQKVSEELRLNMMKINANYVTFNTKNSQVFVEARKSSSDELWSIQAVCNFISDNNIAQAENIYKAIINIVAPDINDVELGRIFETLGIPNSNFELGVTDVSANYYSGTAGSNVDFKLISPSKKKILFVISAADLTDDQKKQISAKNLSGEQAAAEFLVEKAQAEAEKRRLASEKDARLRAEREAERQALEEKRRQDAQDEISIQKRAARVERERADIIRRVNNLFGGGDHIVSVEGVESKGIYFELDVGTSNIYAAREIAADAAYYVLDNFSDYEIHLVSVIVKDWRTPLGIVNWWADSGFEFKGGLRD